MIPLTSPFFPREPAHGDPHGWRVGEGQTKAEHEAVGDGGERHAVLDAQVGEEDAAGHEGRAEQDGQTDPDPLLQIPGDRHEGALADGCERRDPNCVAVDHVRLKMREISYT